MPLRSSSSSVLRWPDRQAVDAAVRAHALALADTRPDLLKFGYFGSYARGDWGVGSDVDLVAVVTASDRPFIERAGAFDTTALPAPADLLVYTLPEWVALQAGDTRFARELARETVWVFERDPAARG